MLIFLLPGEKNIFKTLLQKWREENAKTFAVLSCEDAKYRKGRRGFAKDAKKRSKAREKR
jgi:hypothetical protein